MLQGRQKYSACLFYFTAMALEKLTARIYNNTVSGLRGADINEPFTMDQIEDAIVQERMQIIKEYSMKNMIPLRDLMYSIPCVPVDCSDINRCCCPGYSTEFTKHIEIPQVFNDFGNEGIDYIGTTDRLLPYKVYTDDSFRFHRFKRRRSLDPFVWVDTTPNKNNMNDAFIFNATPMLSALLVIMIPSDPRQLDGYGCCASEDIQNLTFIDTEIEKRLTEKYIRFYRQLAEAITPNDQTVKV